MKDSALDLNDQNAISALDNADMLGCLVAFNRQCREAADIGRSAAIDIDPTRVANIMVMGMGGSGISGDVLRVLFEDELKVPLLVNRCYDLPAHVGPDTLAIAVSYSGNTEETLSATREALDRGAQVAIISSGGEISRIAAETGASLITIPAGLQPRASLGYLSIPPAIMLERLGLVEDVGPALEETIELLERQSQHYGPGSPLAANQAKQLALRLLGKLAVIYGSEGVTGLAAFRFRCQINENSKCPAKWNMLPELDHNEITGWQELGEVSRQFRLIFFRDSAEHSQVKKRIEITRDLIKNQFEGQEECWASGVSKMARLFSLIYLGDFSSVYLALLYGLDPSPVERIELLKKRLVS